MIRNLHSKGGICLLGDLVVNVAQPNDIGSWPRQIMRLGLRTVVCRKERLNIARPRSYVVPLQVAEDEDDAVENQVSNGFGRR